MKRLLLSTCVLGLLAATACESRQPATRAGETLDRAGSRTGQALGRAANDTGAAIGRAGDWMRDRTR
ncbi:MAG: hypothetical protein EON47_12785 [Acetobacteraceae bacterium]|nr:MAG: hypothetical protein EON47_12785 [Acetobacteraceae bacterium]